MTAVAPTAPAAAGRRRTVRQQARSTALHVACALIGAAVLVPLLFGVLGGFKDKGQLYNNSLGLPKPWVLGNYADVLSSTDFWRFLANSTVIAVAVTFGTVLISAMAAFVFARYAFRGREVFFTIFATGLMFPFAVAVLPLFVLERSLGLLNNPLGVILPEIAFGLPLTIIILRSFFRTIPAEVEEAAVLDGCSPFRFFWRILLPMARPALATVSVFAIVASWNNFMLPLVVFNDPKWWTLPLGVTQFQGQYAADTARILAYVVLAMVPALAFYAVAERQLVGGLATGALKG